MEKLGNNVKNNNDSNKSNRADENGERFTIQQKA